MGIDAQARSRILELIAGLGRQGLTVIYTTHYLEEAEQLCDRIGVIDRGRLVALGDKESLISQIGDVDLIRLALPADRREAWLEAGAIPLEQLEVERPNLETLYLNLTGRGLREGAP